MSSLDRLTAANPQFDRICESSTAEQPHHLDDAEESHSAFEGKQRLMGNELLDRQFILLPNPIQDHFHYLLHPRSSPNTTPLTEA
mmetsp:Transcript_38429/g.57164  ORF Transcript_38429/g.57164 Transcript_38429/m.57164 type:complete len:85 (-) Transcript_38429:553-807(-)